MTRSKEGRILGLIGGLGPGATVHYYRGLIAAHNAAGRVARMLIAHADVDRGRPLAEAGKLDELACYLNGFVDSMAAGGAEMAAIVAVTPHICSAQLAPLLKIPLIDMVDVVYDRSSRAGIDRLRELAHTLIKRDGAEAVLLAGTDLSMVMNEENAGFPALDCAGVHIAAITKQLLS